MGKFEDQPDLPQQQIDGAQDRRNGSTVFCERCSAGLSRIGREINFKCAVVLILAMAVFLSAIFWVLPLHSRRFEFDAKDEIKHLATVQAYFRLQKPVSVLIPHIARLEYDIFGEISVPFTKVAILSMHKSGASNWTDVVFGVLSDPRNDSINSVSLSVLRSSLVGLFLEEYNLTLTTSIFGQPSSFEILKFPGGITVIPEQSASFWQMPQILFNFTLLNSIYDIKENLLELKQQLKSGLRLRPYENVFVQVTNKNGSTKDPPVTVQASIMSDMGGLQPQRLKQLAQTITGSPAKNLGLNNTVFGRVKEISLSSYLNRTLHPNPPTPSPAPSPVQDDYAEAPSIPPYTSRSPSDSPTPSPTSHRSPPCFNCDASSPSPGGRSDAPGPEKRPHYSLPPKSNSPAPSPIDNNPPHTGPHCGSMTTPSPSPASHADPNTPTFPPHASIPYPPPRASSPQLSPDLSPLPVVSYGSNPDKRNGKGSVASPPLTSPSISPSPSSSGTSSSYKKIGWLGFFGLVTFHLVCRWL